MKREISGRRRCPCGSGRRYAQCCKRKRFRWVEDESGAVFREIPLSEQAEALLAAQLERFRQVFGRDPLPDDHVFFEHELERSQMSIEEEIGRLMVAGGMDPALVYAWRQTGRMVTEENQSLIPEREVREWAEAVRQYREGIRGPSRIQLPDGRAGIEIEELLGLLKAGFQEWGHLIASLVSLRGSTPLIDSGDYEAPGVLREFCYFCLARGFQAIKAAATLTREGLVGDALSAIRTLYETFTQVVYARTCADALSALVESQVGLSRGTHAFEPRSDGRVNTRVVIRLADQKRIRNDVSPHEMVRVSENPLDREIFSGLYGRLSREAHPNIRSLDRLRVEGRLAASVEPNAEVPLVHSIVITALLLEQVYLVDDDPRVRGDIEVLLAKLLPGLVIYLSGVFETKDPVCAEYPELYLRRVGSIALPSVQSKLRELCGTG